MELTQRKKIDKVLQCALQERRPAYLSIPTDIVFAKVSPEPLHTSLSMPWNKPMTSNELSLLKQLFMFIKNAQSPVIIADVRVQQYGHTEVLRKFLDTIQLPTFDAPLSKGIVDSSALYFKGTYLGASSLPSVLQEVNNADLVLRIGHLSSDSNTGGFSANIESHRLVDLDIENVNFFGKERGTFLCFSHILSNLTSYVASEKFLRQVTPSSRQMKCEEDEVFLSSSDTSLRENFGLQ